MTFGPIVSPEWLREHIEDPDLRVIDFRWYLVGGRGIDAFGKGHIPGAVFVDLEAVTGTGGGRHPLPTGEQFESAMQRGGVSDRTKVVAYDDAGGSVASRLWFLLRFFGHESQAVLDGGLGAWGAPLETEAPQVARGDFHSSTPDRSGILDFEAVRRLTGVPLIDARAGERYRGEKEPIDPKAGHIPGALSAPWSENLGPDGRFKSPEELRKRFAELGIDGAKGAVAYCGSGVNATHDLLAMELAGIRSGRLYAGSWSDWSSHEAPVATGKDPG
ncbi:MAG TPA: sulfurtransferase [Candidatus Acidoferrum sp.]|jgi:thiosulfate/3-mercaptopyruvate sulfurtransferase|nr:sulfurtransferase [Candidatus Acidoferrum sp.]